MIRILVRRALSRNVETGLLKPLVGRMQTGGLRPDLLIDVKKIVELNVLSVNDDGLHVGAAVPCYRIYGDPAICQRYSAVTDSCRIIGGIQIQSRASQGGNLCNSGPAADSTSSMIVLRDTLDMTGTKEGCSNGNCGACTVIMNGRAVVACLVLAVEAEDAELRTIEGVSCGSHLDEVQSAFLEGAALQCGICTPGFIMQAEALSEKSG